MEPAFRSPTLIPKAGFCSRREAFFNAPNEPSYERATACSRSDSSLTLEPLHSSAENIPPNKNRCPDLRCAITSAHPRNPSVRLAIIEKIMLAAKIGNRSGTTTTKRARHRGHVTEALSSFEIEPGLTSAPQTGHLDICAGMGSHRSQFNLTTATGLASHRNLEACM